MKRWGGILIVAAFVFIAQFNSPVRSVVAFPVIKLAEFAHKLRLEPEPSNVDLAPSLIQDNEEPEIFNKVDYIAGRVYGAVETALQRELLVTTTEQVQPGAVVVCGELRAVCGKVSRVEGNTARISLLSDPSVAIAGEVAGTDARGIISGNTYSVQLQQIPDASKPKKGDNVVTSGLGGIVPKGLFVGVIAEVVDVPGSIFTVAEITTTYSIQSIQTVLILR